jgi:hypothetical protein
MGLQICGPVLSNIAVSALRSTVNMLSRLSVQIRYPMRPFGMVRELLTVAREAPNLIFLALDIGFSVSDLVGPRVTVLLLFFLPFSRSPSIALKSSKITSKTSRFSLV